MADIRLSLHPSDGPFHIDLAEWLRAQGVTVTLDEAPSTMGTAETVSMIVSGAAGLRGALLVLREWIRARQTTVSVKTRDGLEFRITSSTSDEALGELIERVQSSSESENGHADE